MDEIKELNGRAVEHHPAIEWEEDDEPSSGAAAGELGVPGQPEQPKYKSSVYATIRLKAQEFMLGLSKDDFPEMKGVICAVLTKTERDDEGRLQAYPSETWMFGVIQGEGEDENYSFPKEEHERAQAAAEKLGIGNVPYVFIPLYGHWASDIGQKTSFH